MGAVKAQHLAERLRTAAAELAGRPVVTGFDGFVDEMITVVEERAGVGAFTRVETIGRWAALVAAAAGRSSLREVVVTRVDPGGCAVNLGDGLAALGVPVSTFATVGDPPHPAFAGYAERVRLHTLGVAPGRTLAFEFADGKLMFSAVASLAELTPERLRARLADGTLRAAVAEAPVVALTNWTLYPHMTACWAVVRAEVLAGLGHRPLLFFDLVDPSSRSDADVQAMLADLPRFRDHGPVVLGLNRNEANRVGRLVGLSAVEDDDLAASLAHARAVRAALGIDEVVVHALRQAVAAGVDFGVGVVGPYCERPVKSTGAGDRFNAGYLVGAQLRLGPEDRLRLAVATSGLYVRLGRSPDRAELADFLERGPEAIQGTPTPRPPP